MKPIQTWVVFCLLLVLPISFTRGDGLRVASYNLMGKPQSLADQQDLTQILRALGAKAAAGAVQPVDLLAFQEGPVDEAHFLYLEGAFEAAFGGDYEIVYTDLDGANSRTGFVYNAGRLNLEEQTALSFGWQRSQMFARFSVIGSGSAEEFYIFSCHFTEGDDASAAIDRLFEALDIRSIINILDYRSRILVTGTFGIQDNTEDAYQFYLNNIDMYDASVLDFFYLPAIWTDNEAFLPFHTSEPTGLFGGMSQRADNLFVSRTLDDDVGMEFTRGSDTILGNNGTHDLASSIASGTADPIVQGILAGFSDHLPIFGDFTFDNEYVPVNDFYVGFANSSYIVRPSGPFQSQDYLNIEGNGNGVYASFGVLDFDLADELTDLETLLVMRDDMELVLSQANASFSANGPYAIYVCTPSAAAIPIDSTFKYQAGNNGLACVPAFLSAGATHLRTYPGVHRDMVGNLMPYGSSVHIALHGQEVADAFFDATANNGKVRLLIVPLTDSTACTFAGVTHGGWATPPRYFADAEIHTVFAPDTLEFVEGFAWSGDVAHLRDSDDQKLVARTNGSIVLEVTGNSRVNYPDTEFRFIFEASVRSTTPIEQKIELWDFDAQAYEVVDVRNANVLGDLTVTIEPNDKTRFVEFGPGTVKARITFTRQGLARGIQAFIDQVRWTAR